MQIEATSNLFTALHADLSSPSIVFDSEGVLEALNKIKCVELKFE